MLDDGTIYLFYLFIFRKFVYIYSQHGRSMISSIGLLSISPFELRLRTSNPKSAPVVFTYEIGELLVPVIIGIARR